MKKRQLRAIYTNPIEISSEQALLEQVQEFAEIKFNQNLYNHITVNKNNIKRFTSGKFDGSKYSPEYLNFLEAMIQALTSAESNVNTRIIRDQYALYDHYSRQPRTKKDYPAIEDIKTDSTLESNVNKRLDAFKKKLEAIRDQQLILKAKSLAELTSKEVVEIQQTLSLMQDSYLKLCSNYSLESSVELDRKLESSFGEQSILQIRKRFAERKKAMDSILEACEGTPVAEAIRREQSMLEQQTEQFELIVKRANELMNLHQLLKQIKAIEGSVTEKASTLREDTDAPELREFIRFVTDKEKEIQQLKQGVKGNSKPYEQTDRTIDQIEQSIQQHKQRALLLLEKIEKQRNVVPENIEDNPIKALPKEAEPKNQEVLQIKKERLEEAINLIQRYREKLEKEPDKQRTVRFFHKSRNSAKIKYCTSLVQKLTEEVKTLTLESDLHQIINRAHGEVILGGDQTEITKGGSYFGTSRMLSLQRLLGIDEAWEKKGHSKFLGFSTQSDLHGLKTSGVVGDDVRGIVSNYYSDNPSSREQYQELIGQVFPDQEYPKPPCN
ncbi:hypothetical protein [Legionella waltersii]|uniref:Uncharacterized protein n=1 Tax=Legionella waltersii TaxID=66969 RepID=A0A0W1APA0_9GAMM|nr:hypothetical protein [Legionella waltersii]KTD83059.1 hypothetical protein Lwal_0047 [Legionella waltersii]SNV08215.1 Uncharacterised protein [Legionella waltersii]